MHALAHIIMGHEIPKDKSSFNFKASEKSSCVLITRLGSFWGLRKGDAEISDYYW
jgi:hypothetical protein